jgi:hypothetical protein
MAVFVRSIVIGLFALVAGCGGGGGDGGGNGAVTAAAMQPAATTGTIKILFGDGPVDGFDQVLLVVEEVRLLSDGGQDVLLLDDTVTIDLLQLRNVSELVLDEVVEAGIYNKIRLLVQSVTLVKLDDDGLVIEEIAAKLVANGKVDLNPQGDVIEISPGEDLVVEIDVDLDRAVHIVGNGKGEYRFRPVVFVRIIDQAGARLVRLFGQMDNIDIDSQSLDLCNVELLSGQDDLPDSECRPVTLDKALLVGADGLPTSIDNLIDGDFATVLARFRFGLELDESFYQALLLAVGPEGTFRQLFGNVATVVTGGAFELDTDDSAANVAIRLIDDALVLNDDGQSVGAGAIVPGLEAELWGLSVMEGGEEFFRAFLVHLDDDDDLTTSVAGTLVSIDLQTDQLSLQDAGLNEACVQLDDDTAYFQLDENDERVEGGEIAIGDLVTGQDTFIEAFGEFENGCLDADEIVIEVTITP